MLLNRFTHVCLATALVAVLLLGGCRSATKDRIRVLEAEKAEWSREKSDLQHTNAKLRGDLLQAQSQTKSADARADNAEQRLSMMQPQETPATNETAPAFDPTGIRGLDNMTGIDVRDLKDGTATIVLSSDVSFGAGRTDLSSKAETALRKVAGVLKSTPGVNRVRIEGHTDSDPIVNSGWASNEALSLARATNVQKFLIHQGISGELMSVDGFGASRPIASNKTKQGKASNRRVEIVVVGN